MFQLLIFGQLVFQDKFICAHIFGGMTLVIKRDITFSLLHSTTPYCTFTDGSGSTLNGGFGLNVLVGRSRLMERGVK